MPTYEFACTDPACDYTVEVERLDHRPGAGRPGLSPVTRPRGVLPDAGAPRMDCARCHLRGSGFYSNGGS